MSSPGLLYVYATLLPLASFLLLLLAGGLRHALRPHRESATVGGLYDVLVGDRPPFFQKLFNIRLYNLLGGDTPPRWPAYVATGAIAASFVLVLAGFVMFLPEQHERHHLEEEVEGVEHKLHAYEHMKELTPQDKAERTKLRDELKAKKDRLEEIEHRWSGHATWLRIGTDEQVKN